MSSPPQATGKTKSIKRKSKTIKIPIENNINVSGDSKTGSNHVTYEDVETFTYVVAEKEAEERDDKFGNLDAQPEHKFWDEVEMKHHGFVDGHGHHESTSAEGGVKGKLGHVPFDEVEMKHSGYVDTRCHHMTESELIDDPEDRQHLEDNSPHVNFDSKLSIGGSVTSSTTALSNSQTRAIVNLEEGLDHQKSQHLQLDSKVESIDVDVGDPDDINGSFQTVSPRWHKVPWDELELKEHGLVDAGCHHKMLPEDEVRLLGEGKIEGSGYPLASAAHRIPYDEIEMKHSGFVDNHGHHMTESDLLIDGKSSKRPPENHVIIKSLNKKSPSTSSTDRESKKKQPKEKKKQFQGESGELITEPKRKGSEKKSKSKKRKRTLRLIVSGILTVTKAKSTGGVP